jgi:hypothetical protein
MIEETVIIPDSVLDSRVVEGPDNELCTIAMLLGVCLELSLMGAGKYEVVSTDERELSENIVEVGLGVDTAIVLGNSDNMLVVVALASTVLARNEMSTKLVLTKSTVLDEMTAGDAVVLETTPREDEGWRMSEDSKTVVEEDAIEVDEIVDETVMLSMALDDESLAMLEELEAIEIVEATSEVWLTDDGDGDRDDEIC